MMGLTMADDKVIKFPTGDAPKKSAGKTPPAAATTIDPAALSEDQRKALSIVLGGMPFVMIGIQATPSGADFFTALSGPDNDLRNAFSHLSGVIERAYARKKLL
jgi:hypothetical protein